MARKTVCYVLAALTLFTASRSFAAPWKYMGEGADPATPTIATIVELNTASIAETEKNVKRAQYRFNYVNYPEGLNQGFKDITVVADFDCSQLQYKILTETMTAPDGKEYPRHREAPVYTKIESALSLVGSIRQQICSPDPHLQAAVAHP